jgi:hypothetical protein
VERHPRLESRVGRIRICPEVACGILRVRQHFLHLKDGTKGQSPYLLCRAEDLQFRLVSQPVDQQFIDRVSVIPSIETGDEAWICGNLRSAQHGAQPLPLVLHCDGHTDEAVGAG